MIKIIAIHFILLPILINLAITKKHESESHVKLTVFSDSLLIELELYSTENKLEVKIKNLNIQSIGLDTLLFRTDYGLSTPDSFYVFTADNHPEVLNPHQQVKLVKLESHKSLSYSLKFKDAFNAKKDCNLNLFYRTCFVKVDQYNNGIFENEISVSNWAGVCDHEIIIKNY